MDLNGGMGSPESLTDPGPETEWNRDGCSWRPWRRVDLELGPVVGPAIALFKWIKLSGKRKVKTEMSAIFRSVAPLGVRASATPTG